jgi:hypothetical protein
MTQLNLSDQEVFELIMALHAFEKTGALPPGDKTETPEFQEVARGRRALLDKLHDAFDQNAMLTGRRSMRGSPAATSSVPYSAASRRARGQVGMPRRTSSRSI